MVIAMQLRHYAWVIWRSLWLILLVTCLVSGATYAISKFLLKPVYQASALIQVNEAGSGSTVYTNQAQAVTYSLLVTNNVVLQAAAQELKNVTVNQLQAEVSASPLDGTSIIQIRVQASDPQQAATIANVVAQDFINIQVTKVSADLQSTLQQLTPMLNTAKNAVASAQAQLNTLQQEHASTTTIAHQTSVLEDAQSNYDTLLLNYEQTQQQLLQVNNILSRIQRAIPPIAPISPRAGLNTEVAAGLSLLLVLVFVLVRDWLNASIRTPEDVAHLTVLDPLGSVPLSKKPLVPFAPQEASEREDEAIEQTFMIMAMSLGVQHKRRSAVLVTSLRSGEGTTITAANLSISLARAGKRVLLIDANLRRPSLHNLFRCTNNKGLVNGLSGVRALQEEEMFTWLDQWSTPLPNLWLLPSGPTTAQSSVTLILTELRGLIPRLLGQNRDFHNAGGIVDYVVFDTSSLKEGADPVTLTAFTDYTVLVVEAGKEQGEVLNKAGAIFYQLGSPVLGVVVNRQTSKHRPYFYVEGAQQTSFFAKSSLAKATASLAEPLSPSEGGASMSLALAEKKSRPLSFPLAPSTILPSRPEQSRARDSSSPGFEPFAQK
jgi:succinoglycan biosynthesis transport protein ExoP